jgi:hypothetical protein
MLLYVSFDSSSQLTVAASGRWCISLKQINFMFKTVPSFPPANRFSVQKIVTVHEFESLDTEIPWSLINYCGTFLLTQETKNKDVKIFVISWVYFTLIGYEKINQRMFFRVTSIIPNGVGRKKNEWSKSRFKCLQYRAHIQYNTRLSHLIVRCVPLPD